MKKVNANFVLAVTAKTCVLKRTRIFFPASGKAPNFD